ncbi:apolipoprotein N-acyltransferase [Actinotignum urinale]|uniref:Apolipoprotein N-acyltransferase n=1 Tax=Actinotignum urinale TaxID=190146 RepID=A0AAW9HLK0_9ACTO|nr:apolipoprotein N-acyltransferase [Actinotignum urinale]MDY5154531.1 apolipoprotein N-acyltransferase [Actinotignum urinale]WIK59850.1 apolipoprotein N-acyltransferase [Actinotignum urinale]
MLRVGFLLRLLCATCCGILLHLAFPPVSVGLMAIAGVACLAVLTEYCRARGAYGYGMLALWMFFSLHFSWAGEASKELLPQIALGLLEALMMAFAPMGWRYLSEWKYRFPALVYVCGGAFVWVACEQIRSMVPFGGIAWGTLAFSQVSTPLVRLAPWGSTQLVSWCVVAIALSLAYTWRNAKKMKVIPAMSCAASGITIFCVPWFIPLPAQASTGNVRIGVVQGNVTHGQRLPSNEAALSVTLNHVKETEKFLPGSVDLVVWPESASDLDIRTTPESMNPILTQARRLGVPIILGTQEYTTQGNIRHRSNDYVVVMPDGKIATKYSKQHPVPFGEYMPYRDFFRMFSSSVDLISVDMLPGEQPALLEVPLKTSEGARTISLATPICFEVAWGTIGSEAIRAGAEVYVLPTNNASFGRSAESAQQFDMLRFRAVEYQRTGIQVSTMGTSGFVYPHGAVGKRTPLWQSASFVVKTPLVNGVTPAAQLFVVYIWLYTIAGIVFFARGWWIYRENPPKKKGKVARAGGGRFRKKIARSPKNHGHSKKKK